MLTFGGTTPLAGLLRLFDFLLGRFPTPYNGGGIPADVPDKLCREILFYERIVYPLTRSTCIISRIDTKRSSWAVSGVFKHWFKWGNRFSWTRPINHDTFSVSFMAPSSALFCGYKTIPGNAMKFNYYNPLFRLFDENKSSEFNIWK